MTALVGLVVLRLCSAVCCFLFVCTLFGVTVLLPINTAGLQNFTGMERYALSNVEAGSPLLWAPTAFIWVFSVVFFAILHVSYRKVRSRIAASFSFSG